MDKNDPYLSELDAIEDMGDPLNDLDEPAETGQSEITALEGEEPTRIDHNAALASSPRKTEEKFEDFSTEAQEDFETMEDADPEEPGQNIVDLAPDMNVPLIIVMGRKNYTVKDLLELHPGQVLDLDRPPLDPVDLVVGGRVVGKAELVEVEGNLGVRILKIFK